MDGQEYQNSSKYHTIGFIDVEKIAMHGNIPGEESPCLVIQTGNIEDDLDEHTLKEEVLTEDGLSNIKVELVIDEEEEGYIEGSSNIVEMEYTECASGDEWCNDSSNMVEVNLDEQLLVNKERHINSSNVEYYEIPTINANYYQVPNQIDVIIEDNEVSGEDERKTDSLNAECSGNSDTVEGNENDHILEKEEQLDSSNVEYYEMHSIIEDNGEGHVAENEEGHIETVKSEYYEEPTIIVHLGDNLTIDEQGQIHSSNVEYFDVPIKEVDTSEHISGEAEGQIETIDTEFYEVSNDEMGCDAIPMDHEADHIEDEQFDITCDDKEDGQVTLKREVFILSSIDELKELIHEYSERTSSQFVGSSKSKNFGSPSSECVLDGHQISWCDIQSKVRNIDSIIKFDGVPYMIVGNNILHCQFGTNKSAADRERRKAKRAERGIDVSDHDLKYPTKKCGCPAKINIKQIIRFPEFKIEKDTGWKRRDCAARLRQKLKDSRETILMEMRFVGRLPHISEHRYHESLQELVYTKELVLQDLVVKAQDLWLESKSNLEIFELIRHHVINEMFWKREPPDLKMKKYYPTKKDIRNYITRVYRMCRLRDAEKETIKDIINKILIEERGTNISFDLSEKNLNENNEVDSSDDEPAQTSEDGKLKRKESTKKVETFLFCYQTPMQQRLMKRFSNAVYLVEIDTIKPVKRVLTYVMYALLVQTNVDYQVVGLMVISKHRKDGLVEGLNLFREWNTSWNPKYFLVDCCEAIYNAVTSVFHDAQYFLNAHSCEKKWLEFITTPSNDLQEHTDELIGHLKHMQYSLTEESLSVAAVVFEGSGVWQNSEKFRTWFQTKWLPLAKYWVMGYRSEDLLILQHLKVSVNTCLNVYQVSLYKSAKFDGLIELLEWLIKVVPNAEYDKYVAKINESYQFYKQFCNTHGTLDYMQGVPISIIPYVLDVRKLAQKHEFSIKREQLGVYIVEYTTDNCDKNVDNSIDITPQDNKNDITSTGEQEKISLSLQDFKNDFSINNEHTGERHVSPNEGESNGSGNLNNDLSGKEIVLKETEFGWIECSMKLDPGEYTVSFGDMYSYPFCTCSHWMLYRLPCVHMFAVFINVPGWRYDMLSPLYRNNSALDIDYSCITNSHLPRCIDIGCQSHESISTIGTQTMNPEVDIFESASDFSTSDFILEQAKEFLINVNKNAFLFRDKVLYAQIRHQLDKLVGKLYAELFKKKPYQYGLNDVKTSSSILIDNRKPLKICSLNLQQIKKNSALHVSFNSTNKLQDLPKLIKIKPHSTVLLENIPVVSKKGMIIMDNPPLKSIPGTMSKTVVEKLYDNNILHTLQPDDKDKITNIVSSNIPTETVDSKITCVNFRLPSAVVSNTVTSTLPTVNVQTINNSGFTSDNTKLNLKRSNLSDMPSINVKSKKLSDSMQDLRDFEFLDEISKLKNKLHDKDQINKLTSVSKPVIPQNKHGKYTLRNRIRKESLTGEDDECDANNLLSEESSSIVIYQSNIDNEKSRTKKSNANNIKMNKDKGTVDQETGYG